MVVAQFGKIAVSRLFTFGCSFTSWRWSTWADIISHEFDEYQNWGLLGGGNQYIFNSIFECDQRNQFNTNDTVIVCWTNIFREDRYTNHWLGIGNIYTQTFYNADWVKKVITDRGCLVRDLAYIKAVKCFLEQRQVNYHFASMVPIDQSDQYNPERNTNRDALDLYADVLDPLLPSFWEVLKDRPKVTFDSHPLPADHLYYIDQVLPQFVVSDATRQSILAEDLEIRRNGVLPPYNPPKITRL